jgi:hypothetical protein
MIDMTPEGGNIEAPLVKSSHTANSNNEIGADVSPDEDKDNRQSIKFRIESQKLVINPSEKGSWKHGYRLDSNGTREGEFRTYRYRWV